MGELKPKTIVRVSYLAEVDEEQKVTGHLQLRRAGEVWYERLDTAEVNPEPPKDWEPGTLLSANGALWVVRKSNRRDSYRVMPVDLSGKNRTLPIEEFYSRYPSARIQFHPSQVLTRKQRSALADWERALLSAD
jgi:hypothetical protein